MIQQLIFIAIWMQVGFSACILGNPFCTNTHTQTYIEYENGQLTLPWIFQKDTYAPNLKLISPCQTYKSRNEYIGFLKKAGVSCQNRCINGNYSCPTNDCWQVEHIYDTANSDLSNKGYNVNIYGNLIMAYGKWNQQIGHRIWDIVKQEKSIIYGDIFKKARQHIIECNPNYSNYSNYSNYVVGILLIFIIIGCIVLMILVNIQKRKKEQNLKDEYDRFSDQL